jgi:pleiotropic regulator 1
MMANAEGSDSSSLLDDMLVKYKLWTEYQAVQPAAASSDTADESGPAGYDFRDMHNRGTKITDELLQEYSLVRPSGGERADDTFIERSGRWVLMRILAGSHRGWVRCLSVDPSNQFFVSGSNDTTIKIWNLASGELTLTLTGHTDAVRALQLDSDRPYLYSAGEDKQVKSWDLTTNQISRHFFGHAGGVYALARHPELDILVTGGRDNALRLWDLRSARCIMELPGHTASVLSVACQSDEPQIISGGLDKRIRLWDIAAGKASAILTHHQSSVRALAVHPVDYAFVSAAADSIRLWQCPRGDFLNTFRAPQHQRFGPNITNTLSIDADATLVAGNDAGILTFWDWDSARCFQQVRLPIQAGSLPSETAILATSFDKSGFRLIAGCADKTIKILKYAQPEIAS